MDQVCYPCPFTFTFNRNQIKSQLRSILVQLNIAILTVGKCNNELYTLSI